MQKTALRDAPREGEDVEATARPKKDLHYTAFVRLPFPRGDFVDPPLVNWDATKDRALWNMLARNSRGADLDWKSIAVQFDVTLPFILQQAAWLYERQLSQVRAEMKKIAGKGGSPSPLQGITVGNLSSGGGGAQAMRRTGSDGGARPSSSSLNTQTQMQTREHLLVQHAGVQSASPTLRGLAPPMSRTASTNTITQSKAGAIGNLSPSPRQNRTGLHARAVSPSAAYTSPSGGGSSSSSSSSTSSSDDDTTAPMTRSQAFRRPPRFAQAKAPRLATVPSWSGVSGMDEPDEDEEEESPAFLAFSSHGEGDIVKEQQRVSQQTNVQRLYRSGTRNENSAIVTTTTGRGVDAANNAGPTLSYQASKKGSGSEESRSMGSSYSDVFDENNSVSESAMEEAMASKMQGATGTGAVTSRVSTISQALKSRYM